MISGLRGFKSRRTAKLFVAQLVEHQKNESPTFAFFKETNLRALIRTGSDQDPYLDIGYEDILDSFEYDILFTTYIGAYKGDILTIFRDENRYGFLTFGYGSCSSSDALQACYTWEEVDELQVKLFESIEWFDSREEILGYFLEKDWKGQYYWYWLKDTLDFLASAFAILGYDGDEYLRSLTNDS